MQYVDADGVAHTGTVLEFDPNGYSIVQFDNPPTGKKLIDSYTEADLDAMTGRESNSSEAAAEAPSTENASSPIVEENGMDIFNMPDAAPSSPAPATDSNTTSKPSPKPSAPAAPQQRAIDRIPVDEKGNHVFEHAPVEDTAQAFLERANGDVDKAIQTAQFWRNKLNSKIKDAKAKAENAESPEAYMDILNSIQTMEENVKYWEDVVKYLEGVKNGAEVQAEAEAQAEESVPETTEEARAEEATEETPVTEAEEDAIDTTPTLRNVIHALFTRGKQYASKLFSMKHFIVAKTPDFMKKYGLSGDMFTIRYGVISRHFGKDAEHNLSEEIWEQIPDALQHPFAITKYFEDESKQRQKGYRLYTSLQLPNGSYVVVSAEVKNAGRNIEVNAINTIFGRSDISNVHETIE